jgi:hypothetical protein
MKIIKDIKKEAILEAKAFRETHTPIMRGCPVDGQCYCTGKCHEIIGWEPITPHKAIKR